MIITTKRGLLRYLFDVFLTSLGWIAFLVMFVGGIWALLQNRTTEPGAPLIPVEFTSAMGTVASYIALMLVFTISLIVWAKYNQHRFAGVDRRKPPAPLSAAQLRTSFGISENQFGYAKNAKIMRFSHDEEGGVSFIEPLKDGLAASHTRMPNVESPAKEKVKMQPKTRHTGWYFLDPNAAIGYDLTQSWASQRDSYGNPKMTFGTKWQPV